MEINETDMEKLEQAFWKHLTTDNNYGSPCLDAKRPFGNSNAQYDVLRIIGAKPEAVDEDGDPAWSRAQGEYGQELFGNLVPWLKKKYGAETKL